MAWSRAAGAAEPDRERLPRTINPASGWPDAGFFTDTEGMLDPVTGMVGNQNARQANTAKRIQEARRVGSEKPGRPQDEDSFESALTQAESVESVRHLADADQEEAREDRQEHPGTLYPPTGVHRPETGSLDLNA